MMIYRCITWMASRRRSFAGCFSRRIDDCSGLAGSAVGFNPFKYYIKKGPEAHRGRGLASRPFKPSAEADGKREDEGGGDCRYWYLYLYNKRHRQSQEKAQLSKKGLSGRALSEGWRRSGRSLRCLSEASFAGDSGVFARSRPDG